MKRLFTLAFVLAITLPAWAQLQTLPKATDRNTDVLEESENITWMSQEHITVMPLGTEAAGATLWSEDFANGFPTGWTVDDSSGICPWLWDNNGSQGNFAGNTGLLQSTTASNGWLIADNDSSNNAQFGQPSGTTYQYLATYFTTSGISTMGSSNVRLEFEQYFRYNNSPTLNVLVSNVGPNGPWIGFDANVSGIGANQGSQSGEKLSFQLPSSMGNQANIWVKIGWNARVYFWMIDDIAIVEAPDNDLTIAQHYYNDYGDSTRTAWYYAIPERQAESTDVTWGAAITNNGQNPVTNTGLRVEVNYNGAPTYNDQSTATVSLGAFATDSFNLNQNAFTLNNGLGDYDITFVPVSDSVDAFPDDDTVSHRVVVTDNIYARDRGTNSGGISFAAGTSTHAMAQMFEFPEPDTIVGMQISFFNNAASGNGTTVGGIINVGVLDTGFAKLPGGTDFHVIDTNETPHNDFGNIIFEEPVVITTPGEYLVYYEMVSQSDQVWVNTWDFNQDDAPPLTAFVDVDVDGTWGYMNDVPNMRMITKPLSCLSTNILAQATVADATHPGSLTINTVTGGSGNYSFNWSGPSGFAGATTQNLTNLTIPGDYTVTITDENFCTSEYTWTVGGSVDISELNEVSFDLKVVPNPNNGEFTLDFVQAPAGRYAIEIVNIVGQVVSNEQILVDGALQHRVNLSQHGKGIYFVKVRTETKEEATYKVIVD